MRIILVLLFKFSTVFLLSLIRLRFSSCGSFFDCVSFSFRYRLHFARLDLILLQSGCLSSSNDLLSRNFNFGCLILARSLIRSLI